MLTVISGQKLMMSVEMEGGREDFCKFPDTYANIAETAQILSRELILIHQLGRVEKYAGVKTGHKDPKTRIFNK